MVNSKLKSLQNVINRYHRDVDDTRSLFNKMVKNEVDPIVEEILKGLLWLQEKTCGGVRLVANRGQIVAIIEGCTLNFFKKMKVQKHFPSWVEYAFYYAGTQDLDNDMEPLKIEIYFGKQGLALHEYDLMQAWNKQEGDSINDSPELPF